MCKIFFDKKEVCILKAIVSW